MSMTLKGKARLEKNVSEMKNLNKPCMHLDANLNKIGSKLSRFKDFKTAHIPGSTALFWWQGSGRRHQRTVATIQDRSRHGRS